MTHPHPLQFNIKDLEDICVLFTTVEGYLDLAYDLVAELENHSALHWRFDAPVKLLGERWPEGDEGWAMLGIQAGLRKRGDADGQR